MQCCFLNHFIKKSLTYFFCVSFFLFMYCLNMTFFSTVVSAQGKNQHQAFALKKNIHKRQHSISYKKNKVHVGEKKRSEMLRNGGGHTLKSAAAGAVTGAAATSAAAAMVPNMVAPEPEKGSVTGLPIPHFLSLRNVDVVNMRAGPGTRYPIIMIYHRRHMPVKVLREFDVWRLIEDVDGQKGWIQQAILSRDRFFITTGAPLTVVDDQNQPQSDMKDKTDKTEVKNTDSYISEYVTKGQNPQLSGQVVTVRDAPQETANPVAMLKPGVIGSIKECQANVNWCKIKINNYIGWIPKTSFWGLLPQETIQTH